MRSAILAIMRRELLEQRRQPWMLAAVGTLMCLVAATGPLVAVALAVATRTDPLLLEALLPGSSPEALVHDGLHTSLFLGFTQYLGIAAVMAGHGVLHDRQCGTFTFLLLAPVSRRDLLVGKVLGALALPTGVYWLTTLIGALISFSVPLARAAVPEALPGSATFWFALLLGAPAWSAFAGAVCAGISALATDVRTAQQGSWFIVFFAALAAGTVLVWGLSQSAATELGVALVAAVGAALAVQIGAELLGRDLAR